MLRRGRCKRRPLLSTSEMVRGVRNGSTQAGVSISCLTPCTSFLGSGAKRCHHVASSTSFSAFANLSRGLIYRHSGDATLAILAAQEIVGVTAGSRRFSAPVAVQSTCDGQQRSARTSSVRTASARTWDWWLRSLPLAARQPWRMPIQHGAAQSSPHLLSTWLRRTWVGQVG